MNKSKKNINRLFLLMIIVYTILLLIISSIACYYAYQGKKKSIMSTLDQSMVAIDQEYTNILQNFWQIYMPIYESDTKTYDILKNYFSAQPEEDLTPLERSELKKALIQMKVRDSRIEWVGLYSHNRKDNYVLYNDTSGLHTIDSDFPYLNEFQQTPSKMEVLDAREIPDDYSASYTFAICGNAPSEMGNGKIIVGYSLDHFNAESHPSIAGITSVRYTLTSEDKVIFDSMHLYNPSEIYFPDEAGSVTSSIGGEKCCIKSILTGNNSTYLTYSLSWKELWKAAGKDTPYLLLLTLLFTIFSIIVHSFMDNSVKKELSIIRSGLNTMTGNNLEYRLPTDFHQNELPEIAHGINEISSKLSENIEKAYYFELKQKDAQLAELQATFNPHFLYNTLEMLRSKSYSNGDIETSELITQLSALFRGFINAKTFITIKEELAFCNRYTSLLIARYGNTVEIRYNISGELLNYGIIRNVFQLIIENYFVHGFDINKEGNYIQITGKSIDENAMLITIQDNGSGMNEEELRKLNRKIEEPIRHGEKSYGLKNLNQRIKLFYGPDCGIIHISSSPDAGFRIEMRLLKMRVEEYEEKKAALNYKDKERNLY